MNVQLVVQGNSVVLPVKAQPGARRNALAGVHAGMLKVAVTAAAEKGKANAAIIDVLCRRLELRKHQVKLIVGETSPQKKFLVQRVPLDELARRIDEALGRELQPPDE